MCSSAGSSAAAQRLIQPNPALQRFDSATHYGVKGKVDEPPPQGPARGPLALVGPVRPPQVGVKRGREE